MLDLDHFKDFNDNYGHAAGDALLKQLGALLEARSRREDVACRYGGEEFMLILPGAPLEVAARRADELRQAVRQASVESEGKRLESATVSVGVACFPEHASTGQALLSAVDQALYDAKHAGRDRVAIYHRAGLGAEGSKLGIC
jgi:diguanylate cyclase (GGDEF)-like protein